MSYSILRLGKNQLTKLDDRSIIYSMKKNATKTEIIAIGTELISLYGFNATGIDSVLKKAGVPKGSFYHYFGSKEEFGLAVIDHFADHYNQKLHSFLDDERASPLKRIRNYLECGLEGISEKQFAEGCLIGNLGQEMADLNERFRIRLDEIFREWKELFAACLREAQQAGELTPDVDPAVMAGFILSGWEGAILRAKVMKSPQPLRDFIDTLLGTVLKP